MSRTLYRSSYNSEWTLDGRDMLILEDRVIGMCALYPRGTRLFIIGQPPLDVCNPPEEAARRYFRHCRLDETP
jgi:hypothetical protein